MMEGLLKSISRPFAAWRERRLIRKRHKEFDAGFAYALGVLREYDGPEYRRQLQKQADSDPFNPFCNGMRIALNGWRK